MGYQLSSDQAQKVTEPGESMGNDEIAHRSILGGEGRERVEMEESNPAACRKYKLEVNMVGINKYEEKLESWNIFPD